MRVYSKPTSHRQICRFCKLELKVGDIVISSGTNAFQNTLHYSYYHVQCVIDHINAFKQLCMDRKFQIKQQKIAITLIQDS